MFSSRFGVGLRQSRSSPLAQTHARLRPRGKPEDLPRASRIGDDMADVAAAILTGDLRRRTATRGDLPLDHPARRAGELGDALVRTERNELIEDR
jgi:hypothetical protein